MTTNLFPVIAQIDSSGCREIPFVQSVTQTYYDYLAGSSGYVVFIIGAAILAVSLVSQKRLSKVPAWLAGLVIAALALGSLPLLLSAFGIELGCGGGGAVVGETIDVVNQ